MARWGGCGLGVEWPRAAEDVAVVGGFLNLAWTCSSSPAKCLVSQVDGLAGGCPSLQCSGLQVGLGCLELRLSIDPAHCPVMLGLVAVALVNPWWRAAPQWRCAACGCRAEAVTSSRCG